MSASEVGNSCILVNLYYSLLEMVIVLSSALSGGFCKCCVLW